MPTISRDSNIEPTIIVVVVVCLIIFALIKLLPLTAQAEQAYFENTLAQLNQIINFTTANQIMRGHMSNIEKLDNGNPFSLIKDKDLPGNYIGEIDNPILENIKGYQWYFNKTDHTLVYHVGNKKYFLSSKSGSSQIKFKLNLKFADKNENGIFNKGIDEIKGLLLVPQNDYIWLEKPA